VRSGIANPLAMIAQPQAERLTWVRSHPEEWKQPDQWTPNEGAIYNADQVAGDQDHATLTFAEVSSKILTASRKWIATSNGEILLSQPLKTKQAKDLTTYLHQRMKNDRSLWSSQGIKFLMKTGETIPQKAALAKLYIGHFKADKDFEAGTRITCRCGCRDILADWLSNCKREDIRTINKNFLEELSALNIPREMALAVYSILEGSDNVLPFRGIWTDSHRSLIDAAFDKRLNKFATKATWRKGIKLVTKCLTGHSLSLQHLVSSTALNVPNKVKDPATATTMDNYLKRAATTKPPKVAEMTKDNNIFSIQLAILAHIRPNPSSKKPQRPPQIEKAPEKNKWRRRSHSIKEFFLPIARPQPSTEGPGLNRPSTKIKKGPFSFKSPPRVSILRPCMVSDIRTFLTPLKNVERTRERSCPQPPPTDSRTQGTLLTWIRRPP
jgi:hypothetical protein